MKDKNRLLDKRGQFRGLNLFAETQGFCSNYHDLKPVYTVEDEDKDGLISLKKAYLQVQDPTEYKFALKYFYNWQHWEYVSELDWFKSHVDAWRQELQVKMQSAMLGKLWKEAGAGGKNAAACAKYLAEEGWTKKRGRPSKAEKAAYLKREAAAVKAIGDDAERLGLKVVNGEGK